MESEADEVYEDEDGKHVCKSAACIPTVAETKQ